MLWLLFLGLVIYVLVGFVTLCRNTDLHCWLVMVADPRHGISRWLVCLVVASCILLWPLNLRS